MPDLSKRKAAAERSRQRKKNTLNDSDDRCECGNLIPNRNVASKLAKCWDCLCAMNGGKAVYGDDGKLHHEPLPKGAA